MGDFPLSVFAFFTISAIYHCTLCSAASCNIRQERGLPPVCLGQLAREQMDAAGASRYCNPGEFIEVEFRLRFGCDMPTHIDHGVRLEVEIFNETWLPIRFYTPTLNPAPPHSEEETRVTLEEGGRSVYAVAGSYSSSLPLLYLNFTTEEELADGLVIREYLCQNYLDLLRNGTRIRLRWMQRYLTNPELDVATWSLDNLKLRAWDGSCFKQILDWDFNDEDAVWPDGFRILTMRGSPQRPPCLNERVAYFHEDFPGTDEFRRSLLMVIEGENLNITDTCEDLNTCHSNVRDIESGCPVLDNTTVASLEGSGGFGHIPDAAFITCSPFGGVSCGCSDMEIRDGVLGCESIVEPTTEAIIPDSVETTDVPTTEEILVTTTEIPVDTEPPPTTTLPPPTTTQAPPTTTQPPPTTTQTPPTTTQAPPITTQIPPDSSGSQGQSNGTILVNDTVIADPLYTVPVHVLNPEGQGLTSDLSLCFEVHGRADSYLNLVSDECVSVNAHYTAFNRLHFIDEIAIRAVDDTNTCQNIMINTKDACSAFVNEEATSRFSSAGIAVRRFSERVRVSVPNCARQKLVMWIFCQEHQGEEDFKLIKFVVTRGLNLQPTSHGILGQFWNVPVVAERLEDRPLFAGGPASSAYKVTVSHPDAPKRTFPGFYWPLTWESERRQCLYAGNGNAGSAREVEGLNDPIIEGRYSHYIVSEPFDTDYKFGRFTATC